MKQDTIDLPSTHDVQIDLDVPRTISGHTLFVTRYGTGQRSLFHVLHCFSLLCDTCGYCQGMGPLAATFLCYFDPEVRALPCLAAAGVWSTSRGPAVTGERGQCHGQRCAGRGVEMWGSS